jgi:hypothetical protein
MRRINTRADLIDLAKELGVRPDWHENDESDVTATTHGVTFDNAGKWGRDYIADDGYDYTEQYVTLYKDHEPVAAVCLATLFAWATGLTD